MNKIGKYNVLKEIGSGGFGSVYLVEYNGNEYALKQLSRNNLEPEITERFIREALRVEELRNNYQIDYLVQIYDVLFKQHAFVMEYIPESSIDYFQKTKDEGFIFSLIQSIQQLHKIGVVHRDIKPENLRVKNSKPVLIDFGIASWWDSRSNIIPTGTKFYSPPEIVCIFDEYKKLNAAREANKKLIDIIPDNAKERIKYIKKLHDVYSLGITIGELMNGSIPFNRDSYITYLDKGDCEDYQNWIKRIPLKFREFVRRATIFSPEFRPPLDTLIADLKIDTTSQLIEIPVKDENLYFLESYFKCLKCSNSTLPPANFCPYCGEELNHMALHIEPDQTINTNSLPNSIRLVKKIKVSEARNSLVIDLNGEDFDVKLGRNLDSTDITFLDDNWMSNIHGRLIKEGKNVFYCDGISGKIPTNPGSINNIPVGKTKIELLSGVFLLLGSTVFNISKYFGKI
jgi:serine/threonine protein kinase